MNLNSDCLEGIFDIDFIENEKYIDINERDELVARCDKLEKTLNRLLSILPPELKLAFELTDDVPEKTED